jgi:Protoporphyrinogen oxidase
LAGKLPTPSPEEVFLHNFTHQEEKAFVHASFWYPRRGGSQFLADTLAEGLDIRYGASIDKIVYRDGKWRIGNDLYDIVVYTGNVRGIPALVEGVSVDGLEKELQALPFHGTTAVFCEINPVPYTWVYLPDGAYDAHRIICTGNLSKENNASGRLTATVEFTDAVSRVDIEDQLKRIPLNPKYLDHCFTACSYPVQTHATRGLVRELKDRLHPKGFYLTGRFAEWEYYNMDVAAGAAMIWQRNYRMKLEGILTQREWEKRVSFDLVYAWEDIFAQELGVPLVPRSRMAEALVRRLPGRQAVPTGKKHLLLTEMEPMPGKNAYNRAQVIPYWIDFFLREPSLPALVHSYNSCPAIFVSSREAYEYLQEQGTGLPLYHLALSLPDNVLTDSLPEKSRCGVDG